MTNKSLNFNDFKRPTLALTMADENRTVINVSTPSAALYEELEAFIPELGKMANSGSGEAIRMIFDLAARLINCNRSFITVTAEELRDKYGMDLEGAIVFYSAYMDFVQEVYNAKN